MAIRIVAVNKHRPRIKKNQLTTIDETAKYIADRTSLNRGEIRNVLEELHDTTIHFALMGRSVKFERLGIFYPKIGLDGEIVIGFRPDTALSKKANLKKDFTGEILNSDNIEKTPDELVALWNEEHPDDPVVE